MDGTENSKSSLVRWFKELRERARTHRSQEGISIPDSHETVKSTFLHRRYAEENADVAAACGTENAVALQGHFDRYGRYENRGIRQLNYANLEAVLACEDGHFFLSGWADRRVLPSITVAIEIGYIHHDLGEIDACWYHRPDVGVETGDTEREAGFMALVQIPNILLHSQVRILINGDLAFEQAMMRWQSVDHFLGQTLGACAKLADRPAGTTLRAAEMLYAEFHAIWMQYLNDTTYVHAFAHLVEEPVDQSIIVTIYQSAAMLIPQLEALADTLETSATEVIVIGNALADGTRLVEQLRGFCQIYAIRLRLYLCSGNSGFSAANNFGADMARGRTLIFMNPDIFPPETAPDDALTFLTSDPGEALCGAVLYYSDGLLMHSGMYVASDLAVDARRGQSESVLRVEHFGKGRSHFIDDDPAALESVMKDIRGRKLLASAALWKIRKTLFKEMGGLSTDYIFAYYEDADLCLRLLQAGHEIRIDETARWIHMEGAGKPKPPFMRGFMWLNRALFTRRFADSDLVADNDTDLFQL